MMFEKILQGAIILCLVLQGKASEFDVERILLNFHELADDFSKFRQIQARGQLAHHEKKTNETWIIFNKTEIEDFLEDIIDVSADLLSLVYHSMSDCSRDLAHTLLHINEQWAIQMLDADGKIPSGLQQGNFHWPGSYSTCKEVTAPPSPDLNVTGFHGRHCMVSLQLAVKSFKLPLATGVCLPDSCQETDLMSKGNLKFILARYTHALSKKMSSYLNNLNFSLEVQGASCQPMKQTLDTPAIGMLCLLGFFITLLVGGTSITIYEYYAKTNENPKKSDLNYLNGFKEIDVTNGEPSMNTETFNHQDIENIVLIKKEKTGNVLTFFKKFLQCFCVITNGSKILSTKNTKGQMLSINGIRFLSMAWVILGHTFAFAVLSSIGNIREVVSLIDNWEFQVILQGTYSVDTFFLLSGLLLTFLFLKEMHARNGDISWFQFYIHRYWRLTPVYAIILFYEVAVQKYVAEGPFWNSKNYEQGCKDGGWSWNLLYFNNFDDEQCMGWSWYLANDMQFYVISPLFLYPLWRWPRIGISIVSALMVGSWISAMVFTYHYNLLPGYITISQGAAQQADYAIRVNDYFNKIYVKPYNRISTYLIGVLLGYLLWQKRDQKKFLSLPVQVMGWSFSAFLGLSMIYGFYHSDPSLFVTSLYNALSRSFFSLAVAWVIFACVTDHGGIVNSILSYDLFIPLSRLTYCAYLIHPIIMMGYYQSMKDVLMFSHITMVVMFLGFLLLSYGCALVASIAFESPLMALEKINKKQRL